MEIRELRGVAEFHAVEEIQKAVWGCSDLEVVPAIHFIPVCAVGGILLGAFDGETLAGFVYGFPGFEGEERI
ncbi:MAG: GNAT family N-acetyltransferase, partial [Thermoanaerobaculia bacterium]